MRVRYWIWLWLAPVAGAQPVSTLVEEALRNNREILAAQKKVEALRQRPASESSLPDPKLSLAWASNGAPWPGSGLGIYLTSYIGLLVSQEVPAPGKRRLRGEIADKEAAAAFSEYRATRLSVVWRLKQAYQLMNHAVDSLYYLDRQQELLNGMLRTAESRYAAGRGSQQDILRAQTQLAIYATQRVRYEQTRAARQIEINALLNRPQGGRIEVPGVVTAVPISATLQEMLLQARANSPLVERGKDVVQGSELAASLARKDYAPDYTLSGGYFNQGGMPPMWQFRVDFKLPAWLGKQRAEVSEQVFTASQARHDYEAADVGIQASIREQYTLAATARKLVELYQKSVIPEAQLALESSIASYQTGTLDFLSVFSNFTNVVDYELMSHEEVMQFHVALAKLEELTGMEIEP